MNSGVLEEFYVPPKGGYYIDGNNVAIRVWNNYARVIKVTVEVLPLHSDAPPPADPPIDYLPKGFV